MPGHWLLSDTRSFVTRTTHRQQLVQLKSLPQAPQAFQALSFYRFADRLEDEFTCRVVAEPLKTRRRRKAALSGDLKHRQATTFSKPPHNTCDPPFRVRGRALTFKDGRTTGIEDGDGRSSPATEREKQGRWGCEDEKKDVS